MESLMFLGAVQWIVYILSALACFWAWDKMFFWIVQKDLKAFVRIIGVVLLFTPAPLESIAVDLEGVNVNSLMASDAHYAPAFIVILFRSLLEKNAEFLDAILFMLGGLLIGLVAMSLLSLINFFRSRFSPEPS